VRRSTSALDARAIAYDRSTSFDPELTEPDHGGEHLRRLRLRAGLTVEQVAARAGVEASALEEVERVGTERLSYEQITSLVRATQPPRPLWWDEGHEHDLSLVDAHVAPGSGAEANYWARVGSMRAAITLDRCRPRDRESLLS
jgi:transcriptional regulator with XRE-family HTH domain